MTRDVDVVIPVRNGGRLLSRAVDSALTQKGVDVRVVVVDDGSTDGAPDRLPRDPRIHVIRGPRQGIPQALNVGLAACRAPFVARQDADDESLPGRLAAEVEHLSRHPEIGLVATAFETVVGDRVVGTTTTLPQSMLANNPICAGSTVARADLLRSLGGYRPQFVCSSDYDMWLRCAAVAGVTILPVVGYRYRLSGEMTTVRRASTQAAYADLARRSARARLDGLPDPVDDGFPVPAVDADADADVNEWWAREFAALGSRRDALACVRRLPLLRAARVLPSLVRRPAAQVVWS